MNKQTKKQTKNYQNNIIMLSLSLNLKKKLFNYFLFYPSKFVV